MARTGTSTTPQLRLAEGLLAQQARVGRGAVAADVADAHAAVLAAHELVVTHPGCGGDNVKKKKKEDKSEFIGVI